MPGLGGGFSSRLRIFSLVAKRGELRFYIHSIFQARLFSLYQANLAEIYGNRGLLCARYIGRIFKSSVLKASSHAPLFVGCRG